MMCGSGFALSALTGRGVLVVTAGPPSVAILVAAMPACGEIRAPVGSDAAIGSALLAGASFEGAILVAAVLVLAFFVSTALVSATGAGASAGGGAASFCTGLSATAVS